MKNVSNSFNQFYHPTRALLIYHNTDSRPEYYVESMDIDHQSGKPINAHPLNEIEAKELAQALYSPTTEQTAFLQPKGLLPRNVLYMNTSAEGYAIWYTPAKRQQVFFKESLGIPNGEANVPALIWKAGKKRLELYAVPTSKRPTAKTVLYCAPFFNVYDNGNVCMGSVDVKIPESTSLNELMKRWEDYFFNSYFSHTISQSQTKSPIVGFWLSHVNTDKPFPADELLPTRSKATLNNILR